MCPRRHGVPTLACLLASTALASAQQTTRSSLSATGAEGDQLSFGPVLTPDGRFVAFASYATNFGGPAGQSNVYVRDRATGAIELVSVNSIGNAADADCFAPEISDDGQVVAFQTVATNLSWNDWSGWDVYVHDRRTGLTERASLGSGGTPPSGHCTSPAISADGNLVAFQTASDNLVAGDLNGKEDVFVRDRVAGTTIRVSVDSSGNEGDGDSFEASLSARGDLVAFQSLATNLVAGDGNGTFDCFVHDVATGVTTRMSVGPSGGDAHGASERPRLSRDGAFVVFTSWAGDLVSGDKNGVGDVFVRDLAGGITTRVSVATSGREGNDWSGNPFLSADGRFVVFGGRASNLVANDGNDAEDVFRHDCATGRTQRVSVASDGSEANGHSAPTGISADGRFVSFVSQATNLVASDTNGVVDCFAHGPYLTLEVDPPDPAPGAAIDLLAFTGLPSGAFALAAVEVNGTPTFVVLAFDLLDAEGLWLRSDTVPAGLSGNVLTVQAIAIVETGKPAASNPVPIAFQ